MAKIAFVENKMKPETMVRLNQINEIIERYAKQGLKMTLRQLYYQLVTKNIVANNERQYKLVSSILTKGRMCGLVDWEAIEDRLRQPKNNYTYEDPEDAINDAYRTYCLPRQRNQKNHIEVWAEKDAISNVLTPVTGKYGVNILVNRGYGSSSSVFDAYERFRDKFNEGYEQCIVIYIGDFDPSGLDMIRDIRDRISRMLYYDFEETSIDANFIVQQIALTQAQIRKYNPPKNPAKLTDSRSGKYIAEHGKSSWEVDALDPSVLNKTLTTAIEHFMDMDAYNRIIEIEKTQKEELYKIKENTESVRAIVKHFDYTQLNLITENLEEVSDFVNDL